MTCLSNAPDARQTCTIILYRTFFNKFITIQKVQKKGAFMIGQLFIVFNFFWRYRSFEELKHNAIVFTLKFEPNGQSQQSAYILHSEIEQILTQRLTFAVPNDHEQMKNVLTRLELAES